MRGYTFYLKLSVFGDTGHYVKSPLSMRFAKSFLPTDLDLREASIESFEACWEFLCQVIRALWIISDTFLFSS